MATVTRRGMTVPRHNLPRTTPPLTLVSLDMSTRIALAALAFAVIPLAARDLHAQAGTRVRINSSSLGCGPLPTATTSGTSTSAFSGVTHSMNGCTVSASSYAYLGVIGARARAAYAGGAWDSGYASANANSGWTDGIDMTWDNRFRVAGVSTFKLFYNVGATGSVSATQGTNSPAYGSASIGFSFQFAGVNIDGSQSSSAASTGSFGTLAGSVNINATSLGDGRYSFAPFGITMSSSANALVAKNYYPGQASDATATADFGSTLVWQGITGVEAYDALGAAIALPSDFRLQLASTVDVGDYWNSSAPVLSPDATVVPEPATFGLLAIGLLATAVAARRRRTS